MKISIQTVIKADIERVWAAWTTPSDINQWNFAGDDWHNPSSVNDLRVDGQFSYRMEARDGSVGFDFEGRYTEVVPYQRIAYVMADDRCVSVCFETVDGGVAVVETFDAENVHAAELQRQGWQQILDRFARYVESTR